MSQKDGEIMAKECWELFSIPMVTNTGYDEEDSNVIQLQFCCKKTNTCINVYYSREENIDYETLSKVTRTALSQCLHCTGKKPLRDSRYIVR